MHELLQLARNLFSLAIKAGGNQDIELQDLLSDNVPLPEEAVLQDSIK